MPEGPTILLLKENIDRFKGKKVLKATGYSKVSHAKLKDQKIIDIKTWGKHLLICFNGFTIKIHLLMFGSYTINEEKKYNSKLSLHFKNDVLNFYLCQVKLFIDPLDELYDWSVDIMSTKWSVPKAKARLKEHDSMMICDALMDQDIFSGVGNIIKNEVLFRAKVHPESILGKIPAAKISTIIKQVKKYAFEFYDWKKENTLSKHWKVYEQKESRACNGKIEKKITGKNKRQSYICTSVQKLYE